MAEKTELQKRMLLDSVVTKCSPRVGIQPDRYGGAGGTQNHPLLGGKGQIFFIFSGKLIGGARFVPMLRPA